MTHTVDSLMALHDEVVGRSKLTEEGEAEARSRFLAALTEALAPTFQPDWADFENGRECGRLEAAQPNIQNYPEKDISQPVRDCPQPEICGSKECEFCRDTAQPVREPLSDEQLHKFADRCTPNTETGSLNYRKFARAIERAHGIGGDK